MTNGLIGRKLGMTRVFAEDGTATPVTVIEAGPCQVVQVRAGAVQLGFGARKASRATKAALGHAKAAGLATAPQVLREFAVAGEAAPEAGSTVTVGIFSPGSGWRGTAPKARFPGRGAPPRSWRPSPPGRQHAAPEAGLDQAGARRP